MKAYVLIQTEAGAGPLVRGLLAIPGVLAADDLNYPARYVGSYVVTDDCVAGLRFVTCQIFPVLQLLE